MVAIVKQEITPEEWEWRKAFYGFEAVDAERLLCLRPAAEGFVAVVVDQLYEILARFHETNHLLKQLDSFERLKSGQRRYFLELFDGDYGEEYLRGRLKLGRVHYHMGLELEWYLGAYNHYLRLTKPQVISALSPDVVGAQATFDSLCKLVTLDQSLAVTAYQFASGVLARSGG